MKKFLLFFSAMLLALGTAFAQEASNEQWTADYNAETKTLTVTVTATQINGADAATGVEGLVGFIWKDAVGSGTNLPVEKSNNGFTMTAAVSNVEATDKVTLIARWEWAVGGIYQAPDYVYGESGGEEPEPEPAEPVTPTAESYVVTWETPVYDASAQTLTLSGAIATAENAGFEWSQITGPMVNFTINQGSDVTVGAANVDGKYTATFSNVVAGTQLSYKANIITGTNAVVAGSNVTVSDEGWVYTPEGEVEPEPEDPVTVSILAQYFNGNAAFSSTMTVPVATANADGDVDVTCQFYYYSAADEYAQATSVGEVFSDNTEGSLVVDDVEIQASSAFPLPAGTYKFEAVWMYGEEELRTGLSTEVVVPEPEPEPAETWYITGDGADKDYWCGGKNWDPAGLELTLDGEVYVYSTTVQAGTYNFKITNGGWYDPKSNPDGINYGYTNVNSAASTSGYEDGGGNNVRFTVAAEAQITITLDPAAAEDAKITLVSSVDFGQPEITRWTLTGAVPFFVGDGDWTFYEGNDLVETEDGVWTITYKAVQVTAEQANQSYEYKAGANGGYTVGEFPQGGNQTFTMPEAGVYNITFTLNTNEWTLTVDNEDITPKGPDALYLRGDMGGLGWHNDETNPDNMADWALATTTDNIVYVWDWSDAPRELEGNFKFGRLQTAEEVEAGQGWGGLADGVYGTDGISEVTEELGSYPIATPGGNFNMGGNSYLISKITLDLISMTVTFEYDEPDPEISIYLVGGSFGDGVPGVVEEETESATWTFEEPATVSGSFAIEISILAYGAEAADVYYVGPETAGSIVLNEGSAVVEVIRTEEQGNMFVVPEGETWTVSSIVLQGGSENTNGTVTITASVIPTAIDETEAAVVTAADGRIYAEGEFTIVNLAGQDVTDANGSLQGTYIVIAGDDAVKVYVD